METETKENKKKFWGIVNYEIIGDGCLNGTWTNNDVGRGGVIMNEIARKNDNKQNEVVGSYYASWIEPNQQPITGALQITQHGEELHFEWTSNNVSVFKGVGLQVGLHNVIAFYWKTGDTFCI